MHCRIDDEVTANNVRAGMQRFLLGNDFGGKRAADGVSLSWTLSPFSWPEGPF
jgi:hypothetical protein